MIEHDLPKVEDFLARPDLLQTLCRPITDELLGFLRGLANISAQGLENRLLLLRIQNGGNQAAKNPWQEILNPRNREIEGRQLVHRASA
jgi:hypothetical protein